MHQGRVIAYRERGRLALGVVQKVVTTPGKEHVELIDEEGKKGMLALDRVLFDCKSTLSVTLPPADIKKRLQELHDQISAHAQAINLRELWELVREEENTEFPWEELASFLLPSRDNPFAMVSVLDALLSQGLYFKEKRAGIFVPRDPKGIEEVLHQQQMEQERARTQGEFLAWVRERLATFASPLPSPPAGGRYLDLLKGFALHGEFYERKAAALRLMEEIGFRGKGHPWEVAFQLLVALGVWREDEELSLLRYQIPTHFSAEVLEAAANTPPFVPEQSDSRDLTSLFTFTIDDTDTTEVDDALSVSEEDGTTIVGIHITDAGFFVPPDSIIDKAALTRGTTVYLPRGKLPMLPVALSENTASLVTGTVRPTLSFFATVDDDGRLRTEQICRGFIRVGQRLSYTEADVLLQHGEESDPCARALHYLSRLAQRRRALRISQGAVIIDSDEVKVKVSDGEISAAVLTTDSPSRSLVGECMILANEMAARYCRAQRFPALYIAQPSPDEPVPAAVTLPTQRVYVHAARRLMKPSQIGTTPAPHAALGLDVYTQVTSPLRRYHDLQMQHQIKHHLAHGVPLFDEERLQVIAASAQESTAAAKRCERESTRYWLLRFLEGYKGKTVSGHVVREHNSRSFIELDETLLVVAVNTSPPLPLGSAVQMVIGHVDARRDVLSVRLV